MNWLTNARVKRHKRIGQDRLNVIRNQNAELGIRRRETAALQTENANIRQRYAKAQEDLTIVLAEKADLQRDIDNTESALRGLLDLARMEKAAVVREMDEARRGPAAQVGMAQYPPYRKGGQ